MAQLEDMEIHLVEGLALTAAQPDYREIALRLSIKHHKPTSGGFTACRASNELITGTADHFYEWLTRKEN